MLNRFTDFILRNRLHAIIVAFLLSYIPLFGSSIGILIAIFITLRQGALEGTLVLIATLAATVCS